MKGYVVYHYPKLEDWQNDLLGKIPYFDYVTNDRSSAIDYADKMGGFDAGYFVAMAGQLEIV
jgi:hypothetical protein